MLRAEIEKNYYSRKIYSIQHRHVNEMKLQFSGHQSYFRKGLNLTMIIMIMMIKVILKNLIDGYIVGILQYTKDIFYMTMLYILYVIMYINMRLKSKEKRLNQYLPCSPSSSMMSEKYKQ